MVIFGVANVDGIEIIFKAREYAKVAFSRAGFFVVAFATFRCRFVWSDKNHMRLLRERSREVEVLCVFRALRPVRNLLYVDLTLLGFTGRGGFQ